MSDVKRVSLDAVDDGVSPTIRITPRVLNQFLGHVILPDEISIVHGPDRSPITLLAHWLAVAGTLRGRPVAYIDSGNSFSPHVIRTMVGDDKKAERVLRLIGVGRPFSLVELERLIRRAIDVDKLSLVIVDSLAGVLNLSGAPGTASRQRQLFRTMEYIRKILSDSGAHILMTDYSSFNWSSQGGSPVGGMVLAHAVDSIVHLVRLPETKEIVRLMIEKSSTPAPQSGIVLRINRRGVSTVKSGGV